MASGDVAASFGFTQVSSTEDIRLGYQRINDAADFAMKYARKRYSTTAALTGSTGDGVGQMATDTSTGYDYRWNGATWQLWSTPAVTFAPTVTNLTIGNGSVTGQWKYVDGACFITVLVTVGSTTTFGGALSFAVPAAITVNNYYRGIGSVTCSRGGTIYDGATRLSNATTVALWWRQVSGTAIVLGSAMPFTPAAGDVIAANTMMLSY